MSFSFGLVILVTAGLFLWCTHGTIVSYYMFTRDNPKNPLLLSDTSLIDTTKPLVVIIHGYVGSGLSNIGLKMKDEYLKKNDSVVLLYDWSQNYGDYTSAVIYAKIVGTILGDQIFSLYQDYKDIHLVGMGLGAHVAAFAAQQLKKYTEGQTLVGRISGVDPARPLINISVPDEGLSKDDAIQVIVYHCDDAFGIFEPIGTVDFYINGGAGHQPGCKSRNPSFLDYLYGNIDELVCNHRICRVYFTTAINSNSTTATICDSSGMCDQKSKIVFGDNLPPCANGTYYVNVTEEYYY